MDAYIAKATSRAARAAAPKVPPMRFVPPPAAEPIKPSKPSESRAAAFFSR